MDRRLCCLDLMSNPLSPRMIILENATGPADVGQIDIGLLIH